MATSARGQGWPVINVVEGDITKESPATDDGETRMIVNPADTTLRFGGEVSKALLSEDSGIEKRSKEKIRDMESKLYCISEFKPKSGRPILCMHIDSNHPSERKLVKIFKNSFRDLNSEGVKILTVPVIGAGVSKMDPTEACNMVVNALCEWFDECFDASGRRESSLETIRVIAFKPGMKGIVEKKVDDTLREVHKDTAFVKKVDFVWKNVREGTPEYQRAVDKTTGTTREIIQVQMSKPRTKEDEAKGRYGDRDSSGGFPVIYNDARGMQEFRVFFKTA